MFEQYGGTPPDFYREAAAAYIKQIFNREIRLTLEGAKVGSRRDDAMRELTKTTATLYATRIIRELIQNAYDGSFGSEEPRIVVRLDQRAGPFCHLHVANDGQGFRRDNVDAIVNPALSNKTAGNFIGHKGLGFRSVDLISDNPQIFSINIQRSVRRSFDGFCFRFANAEDERTWLNAAGEAAMADLVVGRTHHLQLPVPITLDPPNVDEFAAQGFATLVRLPLKDAAALRSVLDELDALLQEKAPLALFLDRLSGLAIERIKSDGSVDRWTVSRRVRPQSSYPQVGRFTLHRVTLDQRRYLVARAVVDSEAFSDAIKVALESGYPVDKWLEWSGEAAVSVAFQLGGDARAGNYYAFLPMPTPAPFAGFLDAPFFPNPDRRGVDLANPLNGFLLDVVADLCVETAEALAAANEIDGDLASVAVDALAWSSEVHRIFNALQRRGIEPGAIHLPSMRRASTADRWARLDEIFDWEDAEHTFIKAALLVRVCDLPMLRRALGQRRMEALRAFVDQAKFTFRPDPNNWSDWAPRLVADLAKKRRATRQEWQALYAACSGRR